MTSFLNYVTATLRAPFAWRGSYDKVSECWNVLNFVPASIRSVSNTSRSTECTFHVLYSSPKLRIRGSVCLVNNSCRLAMCNILYCLSSNSYAYKKYINYLHQTSKFGELWSPARQQLWPWSRSKVKFHSMVSIERASHKNHACQISMLYQ